MSSYPARFTMEERDWLVDRLKQSDVRGILAAAGDGYLKAVADLIRPDFEKHWTKPYGGETDAEYEKRRSNAHKDKKVDFPRRLEETQEVWEARRGNLSHNVHRFVIEQFCTKSKRKRAQATGIAVPKVQLPRKTRRISGLDVYQAEREKEGATVTSSSGGKFDIGTSRTQAAQVWHGLPVEQREPYETRARTRNQERESQNALQSADGDGEEAPGETPLPAEAIAGWLKLVLDKLGQMNWGGFICAGGPDANGDIRTYIDYVGYNRHGEHLLEAVTKAACFSDDELESLVTLWVEQAKTAEAEPVNGVHTLPYQVLRALQIQKQKPDLPPPEILATVLTEAFEAQKITLRGSDYHASPSERGPAAPSIAYQPPPAPAPLTSAGLDRPTSMHTAPSLPLALQAPLPTQHAPRPRIPDPLVDGVFGYPGPVTVDTSGINFHWGGEYAIMNDRTQEGPLPDSPTIPTSNVRTDLDRASVLEIDTVRSVLAGSDLGETPAAIGHAGLGRGKSSAEQVSTSSGGKRKKMRSKKNRQTTPSGVLMPDAHGTETRARPHRERQLTEKGQTYAAERSKTRRK